MTPTLSLIHFKAIPAGSQIPLPLEKRALKAARRRENRIRRKYERMKPLMEPENVFGAQALFDAAKTCKNGVW